MKYQIQYYCVDYSNDLMNDPNMLNEEQIQEWLSNLRSVATSVIGNIKEPLDHPKGPTLEPVRFEYGDKDIPLVSWTHQVRSNNMLFQLTWKPQRVGDYILWLEEVPPEPKEFVPPQENLDNEWQCQECKYFSLQQGQEWLNQVTHRFDKAEDKMYKDILKMTTDKFNVEIPDNDETFGRCSKHKRLVMQNFPGCNSYTPKKQWTKK